MFAVAVKAQPEPSAASPNAKATRIETGHEGVERRRRSSVIVQVVEHAGARARFAQPRS